MSSGTMEFVRMPVRKTFRDVKPVFDRHHGSVTPANASQITDAAAAMLADGGE